MTQLVSHTSDLRGLPHLSQSPSVPHSFCRDLKSIRHSTISYGYVHPQPTAGQLSLPYGTKKKQKRTKTKTDIARKIRSLWKSVESVLRKRERICGARRFKAGVKDKGSYWWWELRINRGRRYDKRRKEESQKQRLGWAWRKQVGSWFQWTRWSLSTSTIRNEDDVGGLKRDEERVSRILFIIRRWFPSGLPSRTGAPAGFPALICFHF